MITIYDSEEMQYFLSGPIDPDLKSILLERLDLLAEYSEFDLSELLNVVIIEPGDSMEAIAKEIGVSPIQNIVDDVRYPDPAFEPSWEFCITRKGYTDFTFALCDAGLAICLLVPDREDIEPQLLELCRTFGTQ